MFLSKIMDDAHGEENVTQRWGSRGAFAFSSGTIAGEFAEMRK
jgi:hypothetical protein